MARTAASANLSIAQLEQLLNARRSERQRLERERRKVSRRLDQLDARIRQLGGDGSRGRSAGGRVRNEHSLLAVLESLLSRSSKPMKVGDIAEAVQRGGYRTNSANFRGIVNQTLIKDKRFSSAGRGLYQMKK
jgi:hypothetical protein